MKVADIPASKEGRRARQCNPDLAIHVRYVTRSTNQPAARYHKLGRSKLRFPILSPGGSRRCLARNAAGTGDHRGSFRTDFDRNPPCRRAHAAFGLALSNAGRGVPLCYCLYAEHLGRPCHGIQNSNSVHPPRIEPISVPFDDKAERTPGCGSKTYVIEAGGQPHDMAFFDSTPSP